MGFPFERWTEKQEKELVWMVNNGYSLDYCAKHLGRSELAILYRVDKLNLRRGGKYIYNGLGKPCSLTREMILGDEIIFRPIAEMHKDLDAFERKHGATYREVFGEYLLSPARMSVLLSRREKEKQEFNQSRWVDTVPEQFKVGDIVLVNRKKGRPVVCEVVIKDGQGNYLLRELVGNAECWCSPLVLKKTSFPEKPKLCFDHSPTYGLVPCYLVLGRFDVWWGESDLKLKIWYHSPKTGVYKSRWVDSDKIH